MAKLRKLDSLQALRAFAAISVIVHHAYGANTVLVGAPVGSILVPPAWLVELGAAGVDVFFILSGFLMVYIARPYIAGERSAGHFLLQRFIRIWPPYAVVTALACVAFAAPAIRHHLPMPFDLQPHRFLSLLFIPTFNQQGLLQPIVGVGWTLNYEALFYMCFAVALVWNRRRLLRNLLLLIVAVFLLGRVIGGPAKLFLGDPIIFEFTIGALIGAGLASQRFAPRMPWAWIGGGLALLFLLQLAGLTTKARLIAFGVPAALVFIGMCALDARVSMPRWLVFLGDASYSIYLVQVLIVWRVAGRIGLLVHHGMGPVALHLISALAIVAAVAGGVVFHLLVERPLLRLCQAAANNLTGRRSPPPLVAQSE